jgi:hypothetical protein
MMRMTKGTLSVAVAAIVAGVLILSVPRAAHALAAALVQVTNTASNPVITQTVGQQAGQSIQIQCDNYTNVNAICFQYGVVSATPYTVPPSQFLVITAVDVVSPDFSLSTTCPSPHSVGVEGQLFIGRVIVSQTLQYMLSANLGTLHASYPSGVAFGPNVSLIADITGPAEHGCNDTVRMYGYLTSN